MDEQQATEQAAASRFGPRAEESCRIGGIERKNWVG
jgi:hypothetical protein